MILMTKEHHEAWREYDKETKRRIREITARRAMERKKEGPSLEEGQGKRQAQKGVELVDRGRVKRWRW